jgi:hypothetical protein
MSLVLALALLLATAAASAEPASWSAGIQEQVDALPIGGGVVQLPCNALVLGPRASWPGQAAITARSNLTLRGCGASTRIVLDQDTGSLPVQIVAVAGSSEVTLDALAIDVHERCVEACDKAGSPALVSISGAAATVRVLSTVTLRVTTEPTKDRSASGYRGVWVARDWTGAVPRRVDVQAELIQVGGGGRGVEFQDCNHCWARTYVNFGGVPKDDTPGAPVFGLIKYRGVGVDLSGSIVNMALDGFTDAEMPYSTGLGLTKDWDSNAINEGVTAEHITLEGARSSKQVLATIGGYDRATLSGYLRSGKCAAEPLVSCAVDADCASGRCADGDAYGVVFNGGLEAAGSRVDMRAKGLACPVLLTDDPRVYGNVIEGVRACGSAAALARNEVR